MRLTLGFSGNPNQTWSKPSDFNNNIGWGRTSVSYQGVQAKAGVNYHFTWGAAPVVASY